MDNELSQLDALIESDVLDALGKNSENTLEATDSDEIIIEDFTEDSINENVEHNEDETVTEADEEIFSIDEPILNDAVENTVKEEREMSSASLSKLLSELLNNKTIEITIKIKD
jgi:hypothetical protein